MTSPDFFSGALYGVAVSVIAWAAFRLIAADRAPRSKEPRAERIIAMMYRYARFTGACARAADHGLAEYRRAHLEDLPDLVCRRGLASRVITAVRGGGHA